MFRFLRKQKLFFVVEDDLSIQKLLKKSLSKEYNAKVVVFGNVRDLILALKKEKPDVIISDVKMPGITGFYIKEYLYKMGLGIPLIYITALKDHLDVADHFTIIEKPINFGKLYKLINCRLKA